MKNSIKKITFLLIAIMVVVTMFATSVKAEELEEMEIEVIDEMDIIGGSATLLFDDGNGGTYEPLCITVGTPPQEYELPVPEREGYAFFGWYYGDIEITGENVYDAFPVLKSGETSTVYARWGGCGYQPMPEPVVIVEIIEEKDDGYISGESFLVRSFRQCTFRQLRRHAKSI